MKQCVKCNTIKPIENFVRLKNKEFNSCNECNRKKRAQYMREYRKTFDEEKKEKIKAWDREHHKKPEIKKKRNETMRELRKNDLSFKLKENLQRRLNRYLKDSRQPKSTSFTVSLGCTIDEFRKYIESKFDDKMSWENRGLTGWHLDHIIPLTAFDFNNPNEYNIAVHFTNFQPMWASENSSKGGANREPYPGYYREMIEEKLKSS